jgi:hypothetical protein
MATEFTSRLVFPNPLSPSAIEFTAPDNCTVTLRLYDDGGNAVQTILEGRAYSAGTHRISLEPLHLAAGKYLYRFQVLGAGGEAIETKMFERVV